MTFASPLYFLLLLLLIPYFIWYFLFNSKSETHLKWASAECFRTTPHTWRTRLIHTPFFLRIICFALVVTAMARPQTSSSWKTGETEGIDIMLALDISTSMATNDILPCRITAAKDVALNFISNRPNDNIGLTLFGGEAYTQCPLTTDHAMLVQTFKGATCTLQNDGIIQPGTAIGMGIASAVSHLNDSHAKSKVIILLTDGANNTGEISPLMATDMAKSAGIRIYTILLGTDGKVNVPVAQLPNGEVYTQQIDDTVDPTTLRKIAQETGGLFYHATSRGSLKQVYDDIDKLEKSKLKVNNHSMRYEAYQPFILAALLVLLLEVLLRNTVFRKL